MADGAGASKKKKKNAPADTPGGEPRTLPGFTRVHVWQIQAVRDILVVAAVVAVVWAGYLLRAVTVPLLVALLLAYLFEPLIARLSTHPKITRARAVSGLLTFVILAVMVLVSLLIPLLVSQSLEFAHDIRSGTWRARLAKVEPYVPKAYSGLNELFDYLPAPLAAPEGEGVGPEPEPAAVGLTEARVRELAREELAAADPNAEPDWMGLARGGARTVVNVLGVVIGAGLVTFLVPFYFFFFSLWYPAVLRFLRNLIPKRNKTRTLELLAKMDAVVSGFVRGRIIISLVMGVLLAIGWMICGVPYAIVIGLVTGIFCAIPYLGAIGVPVAIGLLLIQGLEPGEEHGRFWLLWIALFPTLVFVIVQLIEGYLLVPAIAGKATNLDPVTIIVAVLAGGSVLGVYGMLLAIPVTACLKILFMEVLLPQIREWTEGRAADFLPIDRG